MSKIEEITIQRVRDSAKIEQVVGKFVKLRRSGVNLTGICPFHDDRHDGNFIVRPSTLFYGAPGRNGYYCFVCEASGDSVKFLMEHDGMSFLDAIRWLGKEFGVPVDDIPVNYKPKPLPPPPPPLPMLIIPEEYMLRTLHYEHDNFVEWLRDQPWDSVQQARIDRVLKDYLVGHGRKGHTIFWQIDDKQRIRTGKMMKYRPKSDPRYGHRYHKGETYWANDWIHACLFRDKKLEDYDMDKQRVEQCLFGQHLLNTWKDATVNIVESEKTAIVMAIAYGNHAADIWMACGGLTNITREKLKPLMDLGRRIQLFPDRDGIKAWREKAAELDYDRLGFNTEAVLEWWRPEDGDKADIADVVLRLLREA